MSSEQASVAFGDSERRREGSSGGCLDWPRPRRGRFLLECAGSILLGLSFVKRLLLESSLRRLESIGLTLQRLSLSFTYACCFMMFVVLSIV